MEHSFRRIFLLFFLFFLFDSKHKDHLAVVAGPLDVVVVSSRPRAQCPRWGSPHLWFPSVGAACIHWRDHWVQAHLHFSGSCACLSLTQPLWQGHTIQALSQEGWLAPYPHPMPQSFLTSWTDKRTNTIDTINKCSQMQIPAHLFTHSFLHPFFEEAFWTRILFPALCWARGVWNWITSASPGIISPEKQCLRNTDQSCVFFLNILTLGG